MKTMKNIKKLMIVATLTISSIFLGFGKTSAATVDESLDLIDRESGTNIVIIGQYMFNLNSHFLTLDDIVRGSMTLPAGGSRAVYYISDATGSLVWTDLLTDKTLLQSEVATAKAAIGSLGGSTGIINVDLVPVANLTNAMNKITGIESYFRSGKSIASYSDAGLAEIDTLKAQAIAAINDLVAAYDETVANAATKLNSDVATIETTVKSKIDLVMTAEEELVVESIALNTSGLKSSIKVGETLNLSGLSVTLTFANGTTKVVTYADFVANKLAISYDAKLTDGKGVTVGNSTVTVIYDNSATIRRNFVVAVTIGDAISITENVIGTYKIETIGNSTISLSGLHSYYTNSIALEYRLDLNGTGFTGDFVQLTTYNSGTKLYTISHASINENTRVEIRVKADADKYVAGNTKVITLAAKIDSIAITTAPNKNTYKFGEDIDLTGIVVEATRGTETFTVPVDKSNVDFSYSTTGAGQTVTVWVDGRSATFTITVNKADGEAPISDLISAEFINTSLRVLKITGIPTYLTAAGSDAALGADTNYVEFAISFDGGSQYTPVEAAKIADTRGSDGLITISSLSADLSINSKIAIYRRGTSTINRGEPRIVNITVEESIDFTVKSTSESKFKHGYTLLPTDFEVKKTNADGSISVLTIGASNISIPTNQGLKLVRSDIDGAQTVAVTITVNNLEVTKTINVLKADGPSVVGQDIKGYYVANNEIKIYGLEAYAFTNGKLKAEIYLSGAQLGTEVSVVVDDYGVGTITPSTNITAYTAVDVKLYVAETNLHAPGEKLTLFSVPALSHVDVITSFGYNVAGTGLQVVPHFVSLLGGNTVSYTWYKTNTPLVTTSWVVIEDQTTATLAEADITAGTYYKVLVKGIGATTGEVTTDPFQAIPTIDAVTYSATSSGIEATLAGKLLSLATYTLQWTSAPASDYSDVNGAVSLTLATANITIGHNYKLVVTGSGFTDTSTVSNTPFEASLTQSTLVDVTFNAGDKKITITTPYVGNPVDLYGKTPTYQWQESDAESGDYSDVAGAESADLTGLTAANNSKWYKLLVLIDGNVVSTSAAVQCTGLA